MPAAEESHGINSVVDNICGLPPDLLAETDAQYWDFAIAAGITGFLLILTSTHFISESCFRDMLHECQYILSYLQGQRSGVDSAETSERLQRAGVGLDHEATEEIIRFLIMTFRSGGKSNLSADGLVTKLEEDGAKWSKASLQVLHKLWSEHGELVHAQQEAHAMLSIGQLVDMEWKLGMSVSSDSCRSLNSPYVTLRLKIVEPSGQICQRSFEMTVPQFQNFHKQFKEIAAVMETL